MFVCNGVEIRAAEPEGECRRDCARRRYECLTAVCAGHGELEWDEVTCGYWKVNVGGGAWLSSDSGFGRGHVGAARPPVNVRMRGDNRNDRNPARTRGTRCLPTPQCSAPASRHDQRR